jgi:hypothetical protein
MKAGVPFLLPILLAGTLLCVLSSGFALAEGDLSIVDLQLVQVVEEPEVLLADKSATVRLDVHSTFPQRVFARIRFRYDFGSQELLEEGPDGIGVPLDPGVNRVYLPGGPADAAGGEPWIPEGEGPHLAWSESGLDFQIRAVLDPFDEIAETDETNNEANPGAVEIRDAHEVRVLFVPVNFNDPDAVDWSLEDEVLSAEYEYMLATYPLAREDLIFEERATWYCPLAPYMNEDSLVEHVVHPISLEARFAGYDRVVICMRERLRYLGIAIGMFRDPRDRTPVICQSHFSEFPDDERCIVESLVAHEIGHTYYLWHPHDIGPEVATSRRYSSETREYDLLQPTFMSYRPEPVWVDKGRYDRDVKTWIPPGEHSFPGDSEVGIPPFDDDLPVGVWRWNLLEQLTDPSPQWTTVMAVAGILDEDDEILLSVPWYRMMGVPDVLQGPPRARGDADDLYSIHLLDEQHAGITYFEVSIGREWGVHGDYEPGFETRTADRVPFRFLVPFVEGTRYVEVRDSEGQLLASRTVSLHDPTVEITGPQGGETFAVGGRYPIEWEAEDADGDELTYLVFHSRNDGRTWIPIANGLTEPHFEWDTSLLPPGANYRLRVAACDGVNVGESILDIPLSLVLHEASVDVKPGSCPNPLNPKSRGVLPVAVCGSADLDVTWIDPESILVRRDGAARVVRPVRVAVEDVATPYEGGDEDGCHDERGDGLPDLSMKFDTRELVEALELTSTVDGTARLLVSFRLRDEFGGMPYQGVDQVEILED